MPGGGYGNFSKIFLFYFQRIFLWRVIEDRMLIYTRYNLSDMMQLYEKFLSDVRPVSYKKKAHFYVFFDKFAETILKYPTLIFS